MQPQRDISHSTNTRFDCREAVMVLPFGRRSFLPAIVERCDGRALPLGDDTDREAYTLYRGSAEITLLYCGMGPRRRATPWR